MASPNPGTAVPSRSRAVEYFAAKLQHETDPSDVHEAMHAGAVFTLLDVRGASSWRQGRIRGAAHLPRTEIAARAAAEIPWDRPVVVHCWGPGCNGATRAALELARLGYDVKEMIGGYEYWVREGWAVENDHGALTRPVDPLTAPHHDVTCGC
jgi:rhodanese-related sulfurtransferase